MVRVVTIKFVNQMRDYTLIFITFFTSMLPQCYLTQPSCIVQVILNVQTDQIVRVVTMKFVNKVKEDTFVTS